MVQWRKRGPNRLIAIQLSYGRSESPCILPPVAEPSTELLESLDVRMASI